MHVASVTLDEVLRAAAGRAAALVPETAGYLALAIGDASARLPYRIEDELVTLTTEGTVRVARGREAVAPEEGARVLRDHLRRLLSVSAGSMPGLAQAGAPRPESGGPEVVIAEIEAALIPVNRSAARRSLARLARDAARARDAGRMGAAPPMAETSRARRAEPAPSPRVAHLAEPAAPPARSALPPMAAVEPPPFEAFEVDVELEDEPETPCHAFVPTIELDEPTCRIAMANPDPERSGEPARPAWVSAPPVDACELADPTIIDPDVMAVVEGLHAGGEERDPVEHATPRLGTPAPSVLLRDPAPQRAHHASDEAARSLEAALLAGRLAPPTARPRPPVGRPTRAAWQADLGRASTSDVDSLLASFRPSDTVEGGEPTDGQHRGMRRDLKKLVGIDATQLPPRVALRGR
jgi:hypothetical protein